MRTLIALSLLVGAPPASETDAPFRLPDVDAWLGMATVTKPENVRYWWSPVAPQATVAVNRSAAAPLLSGEWMAMAPNFQSPLTYLGNKTLSYGCDEVPTTFDLFNSSNRPQEGPVVVARASVAKSLQVIPLVPLTQDRPSWLPPLSTNLKEAQVWQVGDDVLTMEKRGEYGYRLTFYQDQQLVFQKYGQKTLDFDGAKKTPVDLTTLDVQVPRPMLAYRPEGRRLPTLVLFQSSYEGFHFTAWWPRQGDIQESRLGYLYWCAF